MAILTGPLEDGRDVLGEGRRASGRRRGLREGQAGKRRESDQGPENSTFHGGNSLYCPI